MLFITEADLREQFKMQPFINFKLPPETKLTPGARQFLLDRGVDLYDEEVQIKKDYKKNTEEIKNKPLKLIRNMKSLHAETLLCGAELIGKNLNTVQDISKISRQILGIVKYIECGIITELLECKKCTGICNDNFSCDIGDCFEINDFHIPLENGKDIILLYKLRLLYRNLYEDLDEYELDLEIKNKVGKFLQQIINTISRLICETYGSKQCQRL